jgi:hypothetical protein
VSQSISALHREEPDRNARDSIVRGAASASRLQRWFISSVHGCPVPFRCSCVRQARETSRGSAIIPGSIRVSSGGCRSVPPNKVFPARRWKWHAGTRALPRVSRHSSLRCRASRKRSAELPAHKSTSPIQRRVDSRRKVRGTGKVCRALRSSVGKRGHPR